VLGHDNLSTRRAIFYTFPMRLSICKANLIADRTDNAEPNSYHKGHGGAGEKKRSCTEKTLPLIPLMTLICTDLKGHSRGRLCHTSPCSASIFLETRGWRANGGKMKLFLGTVLSRWPNSKRHIGHIRY